jgi:hypothetical protein
MSTPDESPPVGFGEMPISLADDHNLRHPDESTRIDSSRV